MCRQNQALGMTVIGFAAGLLIGCCCELTFGVFLIGIGGVSLGLGMIKKK